VSAITEIVTLMFVSRIAKVKEMKRKLWN